MLLLIPLLPLAGFVVNAFFGRRLSRSVSGGIACAVMIASFLLVLVLGASFPVMFVGWEGVGLCSYLLIGFWFRKRSAADAGKKAFIVNRIGDFGFILGT